MTIVQEQAPVAEAEAKVEAAAPKAVQPEVAEVEKELNAVVDSATEKAPEEEAKAAAKDPGVAEAVKEVEAVASGDTVSASQVSKTATTVVKEVKAGYKTTEFWVTVAVITLTQLGTFHLPGKYGQTIATAAAAAGYAISRGLAK